jgi:hypothetical protein
VAPAAAGTTRAGDDGDGVRRHRIVFESLKAGASGYILKRAPIGELLAAIRELAAGGAPMSGVIARKVVQYFGHHGPAPEVKTLTAREHQVLVALSQGEQYRRSPPGSRSASTRCGGTSWPSTRSCTSTRGSRRSASWGDCDQREPVQSP